MSVHGTIVTENPSLGVTTDTMEQKVLQVLQKSQKISICGSTSLAQRIPAMGRTPKVST